MIVIDSNVLAYLYLPGEFTDAAESLLTSEPEWAVPMFWRTEFRNTLAGSELELVRDSDCSAYDCEFIALALKLGTRPVTVDKTQLKAFPSRAVTLDAA